MLFLSIVNNTMNILIAYGLRANGKFRTDRYNFSHNSTWTQDDINTTAQNLEDITGFKVVKAGINIPNERRSKPDNETRYILYSENTPIPLRFKPLHEDNFNIFKEHK